MIDELVYSIHENARAKGFWGEWDGSAYLPSEENRKRAEFNFVAKQCMMITSEVSELMESIRKDKGQAETESEFADVFIRLADLWEGLRRRGYVNGNLSDAIKAKADFNTTRPEMHGVRG